MITTTRTVKLQVQTARLFVAQRPFTYSSYRGTWGKSGRLYRVTDYTLPERGDGFGKSGVLEHKSGNTSKTRKDRGKVTMEYGGLIGAHHSRPPPFYSVVFPKIGGSQPPPKTPIENCGKTSARRVEE